jgi:hypothetical protein
LYFICCSSDINGVPKITHAQWLDDESQFLQELLSLLLQNEAYDDVSIPPRLQNEPSLQMERSLQIERYRQMEPSLPIALVLKVREIHMCTQWSSATYASKYRNQPPGRSSMGTGFISRLQCFATGHFAIKRMKSMMNYCIFLSNSMLDCK